MRNDPLFSVVIPAYNYGRFLSQCLASVFSQHTRAPLEVILIDDASTDTTPQIAQEFASRGSLRYVRHAHTLGHLATAREGLALARGTYLMRLDADDYLADGIFAKADELFSRYPEVGVCYGNYCLVDEHSVVHARSADHVHAGKDFKGRELDRLLFYNYMCPPTIVVRRAAWEAIGLSYDPQVTYSEDWWVWLRLNLRHDFYYCNEVWGNYRVHPGSLREKLIENGQAESSHRYILDHFFADPAVPEAMRKLRRRAYGVQYRWIADMYFSCGKMAECGRALRLSLGFDWSSMLSAQWWRRVILLALPRTMRRVVKETYARFAGKL